MRPVRQNWLEQDYALTPSEIARVLVPQDNSALAKSLTEMPESQAS